MHGVIFASFRDYLTAEHGNETTARVFDGEPVYLLSDAYPDTQLAQLIRRACDESGLHTDELLHAFGVFTAQRTFTRLYPAFFAVAANTRSFLLTVEARIHELVRATIPNASPPELHVSELGEEGVAISYTSPRRLCVLLRGLAEGTARHYGEAAVIDETTCMRRGDPSCTFEIRFTRSAATA
jgi:hypothetical protein